MNEAGGANHVVVGAEILRSEIENVDRACVEVQDIETLLFAVTAARGTADEVEDLHGVLHDTKALRHRETIESRAMPSEVAVDPADERLRSLLQASCRQLLVRTRNEAPAAALASRRERPDGAWDLVLTLPDRGEESPLVSFSGDLLEREGERMGVLIEALIREVSRRDEAELALWIDRLAGGRSPEAILEEFVTVARQASRASHISLLFPDSAAARFTVVAGDDVDDEEWTGDPTSEGSALDIAPGAVLGTWTREMVPLQWDDDVFGFVRAGWDAPDDHGRRRVERLIERATPILHTARALSRERDLALRDDLTRAYNRRYFDGALNEEIERARRFSMILSLIFLDLDDLKTINTRWGHLTGSRVLQEVARRILGAVRAIDRVVRFGGDEFCILLPQTDPLQAKVVAERVRDAISGEPIRFVETDDLHISASLGIASYPLHADTRDGIIRAADAAMYAVKCSSKNAIAVAPSPGTAPARVLREG